AQHWRQPEKGNQCLLQILARLQRTDTKKVTSRLYLERPQALLQRLITAWVEASGIPQRSNLQTTGRDAIVTSSLICHELRVDQNPRGPLKRCRQAALHFTQAITWLGMRVVHMGQVVQGHDRRPVEL